VAGHDVTDAEPAPPAGHAQQRLLLVDDDIRLTEAIALYLRRAGYAVSVAHDGMRALDAYETERHDLIVLDVMMPGMDGWEVCRRLRETSWVPIIMLTARSDESDRVMGLHMGADDYIGKPFSLKELAARIEAVLRRALMAAPVRDSVVFDDGRLRLEAQGMQVLLDGQPAPLTATERRLLFCLAERAGRALSVDEILRRVWGHEYNAQHDYVKLYVWRVRQKIEPDPDRPAYIRTERGVGYRFTPGPAATGAATEAATGAGRGDAGPHR
jgi:DNA-binding response OmpR family regulator